MMDDVTEWKSDRLSQKVAGRRLYGMIYEIPLIVNVATCPFWGKQLHVAALFDLTIWALLCAACLVKH